MEIVRSRAASLQRLRGDAIAMSFLSVRIPKVNICTFLLVLSVMQGVTESKTKGGKGLLLLQDGQSCNYRLLPSSVLP